MNILVPMESSSPSVDTGRSFLVFLRNPVTSWNRAFNVSIAPASIKKPLNLFKIDSGIPSLLIPSPKRLSKCEARKDVLTF